MKFIIVCVLAGLAIIFRLATNSPYSTQNRISMTSRAILFDLFPSTCQQHKVIDDNSYICYSYGNVGEYAGYEGAHWLVIDESDAMLMPIEKWSMDRKKLFHIGADDIAKNKYRVTRVAPHAYWVTDDN